MSDGDGDGRADPEPTVRVAADPGSGTDVATAAREAADSVTVVETGPTGIRAMEPLVLATVGGRTAFLPDPSTSSVREAIAAVEDGSVPEEAATVVDHDPDVETLPVPESGPLSVGRRDVLGPCGWVDPLGPSRLVDDPVGDSADGLVGRGRGDAAADDPVADSWERARETDGEPVVVVNANDADQRQHGDRTLLAGAPMSVLGGAVAVASQIAATDLVVYLNEADRHLQSHLRDVLESVADDLPVDHQIVAGPDEFRAGAPTAALEAMEGADRIEPRLQPPTPAEYGLYGRPTVLHTPRTFAQVRRAVDRGLDADQADPGTRVLTVTGDVPAPATVELGSGASLSVAREAVAFDGRFKMAVVGGRLGGVTRDLDVAPTAQSLGSAGLGTEGALELLTDSRCPVATAGQRARFAAEENSGRCVPGREGTTQLTELLRDVYAGTFDPEKIRELARVMRQSSNCKTGAHAPRPVTTAIEAFEPEFRAHADGRCSSGTCREQL